MQMHLINQSRQAGQYVRDKRTSLGLTRVQLAQRAGVSERLLASLELGDATGIRLDKLLAVLRALGLTLAVLDDDGDLPTPVAIPAHPDRRSASAASAGKSSSKAVEGKRDAAHRPYDELYREFVAAQLGAPQDSPAGEEGRG